VEKYSKESACVVWAAGGYSIYWWRFPHSYYLFVVIDEYYVALVAYSCAKRNK